MNKKLGRNSARGVLLLACLPAYLGVPGGSLILAHALVATTLVFFALSFIKRFELLLPHFVWFIFWGASVLFVRADRDYERFRADYFESRYHEALKMTAPVSPKSSALSTDIP